MLLWPDGETIGSISAGCLGEEVTLRAREDDTAESFDSARFYSG